MEEIDVVSVYGGDVDTRLRAQDRNRTNLLRVLIEVRQRRHVTGRAPPSDSVLQSFEGHRSIE